MTELVLKAVESVKKSESSFCKIISSNDAGTTGGHQAGIYIPKNSYSILFDSPGIKGSNKSRESKLTWPKGNIANCRFIYYGSGTRNEYRITRLGKKYELNNLFLLTTKDYEHYDGFIITRESNIEAFLNALDLTRDDLNQLIKQEANFYFKPRARIIQIIGKELISNDIVALVEIIKNSYDADATNVTIELNSLLEGNGEIIVTDDGTGMTSEKIKNVWLEPATPDKKKIENRTSECFGRRLLGEKGIGRFAVHRLGKKIMLISRASENCFKSINKYETLVEIDWEEFTEDVYLDRVPVWIREKKLPKNLNHSGTIIRISDTNIWTPAGIRRVVSKLRSLENPIKPVKKISTSKDKDPGLTINIISKTPEIKKLITEIKSFSEVLKYAFYSFEGEVNEEGILTYSYTFNRPDFKGLYRKEERKKIDLKDSNESFFKLHNIKKSSPGVFKVFYYAWDLETAVLKISNLKKEYDEIIKPNAGVRVYRDGFRVWPYGEEDDDWLNLDETRLYAPKERSVSRKQILGVVQISSLENSALVDQSNREGFIVNEQYEIFYELVKSSLLVFANERKRDKIQIDRISSEKQPEDIVTRGLKALHDKVVELKHDKYYLKDIDSIKKEYTNRINDILERYMMAAAIGLSYSFPVHEVKLRLKTIENVIDDIKNNPELQDKYYKELAKIVNDTRDIVSAVSTIMARQKKSKIKISKFIDNAKTLKDREAEKYNIKLKKKIIEDCEVYVAPGLINTALLNLVDNAMYWVRVQSLKKLQENKEFIPEIFIECGVNEDDNPFIKVIDNGTGLNDPFDLIKEPYYSTKSEGLGLGLFLVNEIMMLNDGELLGYNNKMHGATFELIFKKT